MLQISGKTTDGKEVISGVFRFYETYGLPLTDIFYLIDKEDNAVPDALDLYQSMLIAGMQKDRIISKLREPYVDVFGVPFWDAVKERLDLL